MPSGLFVRRLSTVGLLAAAEAASHPSCLELGTPGRRVGRKVPGHPEQNRVTLLAAPPGEHGKVWEMIRLRRE